MENQTSISREEILEFAKTAYSNNRFGYESDGIDPEVLMSEFIMWAEENNDFDDCGTCYEAWLCRSKVNG